MRFIAISNNLRVQIFSILLSAEIEEINTRENNYVTLKDTVQTPGMSLNVTTVYHIASNFCGIKYSLFSWAIFLWASLPPRNFNVGVAYRNVGMQCRQQD